VLDRVEAVRRVLLVAASEDVCRSVREALTPAKLEIAASPSGGDGQATLARRRFDGVLINSALPDMPMTEFLAALRRRGSPNQRAAVVLLTPHRARLGAEVHLGRGVNRVVDVEHIDLLLGDVLTRLFQIAPRLPMIVPSRIDVDARGFPRRIFCQTVNVSTSGMLVRVPHTVQPGTELGFGLFLPAEKLPIAGHGRAVRRTDEGREPSPGVGVSFSEFSEGDEERLLRNLARIRTRGGAASGNNATPADEPRVAGDGSYGLENRGA
jgi:CheY-like chemotaxis protein